MNQPLSKEEYHKKLKLIQGSYENFQKALSILEKLKKECVRKYANIVNSENCTGDFIENSKNCTDCFDLNGSQDSKFVIVGVEIKDCYDCSNMYVRPELSYQILGTIETYHVAYSLYIFHSQNVLYSEQIFHSKDIFACAGLKRKQYCIFNKQYTKDEYERLVPKIIDHMKKTGEWGQFFPVKYAPHGYNETLAYEYYPMTKAEVLKNNWNWHEDNDGDFAYQGPDTKIPDNIKDVPDDITHKILKCEKLNKFYKIIPQELKFYKTFGIPLPRICPDQRHKDRLSLRNPRKLYARKCDKCGINIQTTYSLKSPETIYCEKCYLSAIY